MCLGKIYRCTNRKHQLVITISLFSLEQCSKLKQQIFFSGQLMHHESGVLPEKYPTDEKSHLLSWGYILGSNIGLLKMLKHCTLGLCLM